MRARIKALCLVLAFVFVFGQTDLAFAVTSENGTAVDTQALLENGDYKEDELLVVFSDDVSDKKIEKVAAANDSEAGDITMTAEDQKMCQVTLDEDVPIEEAIESFAEEETVEYVQPNYRYGVLDDYSDPMLDPESERYSYQLEAVNAEAAWTEVEKNKPAKPATVAVIDTGVDIDHEDLSQNLIKTGKGEYVSFQLGNKVYERDDEGTHGTHCAGVVGAVYGNGIGTAGVASGHRNDLVRVMMVGSSPDGESLYTSDILGAMNYVLEQKRNGENIKVVSMSFGIGIYDTLIAGIMKKAFEQGLTLVAASGNENTNEISYPAGLPEVISVNASDKNGDAMFFSNYGDSCDISAPGGYIYSTVPGDQYESKSGTSMATPCIAAVAALVLDAEPSLKPAQVRNILCTTTKEKDKPFDADGLAYGNIDALAAVEAAKTDNGSVEKIDVKCPKREIAAGERTCIQAVTYPGYSEVTFESKEKEIATVDENGTVEGVSGGRAQITVNAGGKSETVEITVTGEPVAADDLRLVVDCGFLEKTGDHYELAAGESAVIGAYFEKKSNPDEEVSEEVVFESSDQEVLCMNDGFITANKPSSDPVTVTIRNRDSSISETLKFVVKNRPKKISITSGPSYIKAGTTGTYKAALTPIKKGDAIANKDSIVWSTSNSAKAVSSGKGKIKFKKTGKVYVTASYLPPNVQYNDDNSYIAKKSKKQIVVYDKKYSGKAYKFKQSGKLKKRIKLKWKRMPGADGYYIYKSSKKTKGYKRVKTITKGSATSVTLKTKKNGYYKIRAYYKLDNGSRLYGNFGISGRIYGKVKK